MAISKSLKHYKTFQKQIYYDSRDAQGIILWMRSIKCRGNLLDYILMVECSFAFVKNKKLVLKMGQTKTEMQPISTELLKTERGFRKLMALTSIKLSRPDPKGRHVATTTYP